MGEKDEGVIKIENTSGRLTARERVEKLFDKDSFFEINKFAKHRCANFGMDKRDLPADGVITGYGRIDGRLVFIFSQDFQVMGGSIGEIHAKKICTIINLALKNNSPLVGLYDSGGARIQEGIDALSGCGQIFYSNIMASGRIPQISAIMGPCAGAAAYSPALTDFIFMVKDTSSMFLTGPRIIRTYTGASVSRQELGGADIHSSISGVADFVAENDIECLTKIKRLLGYFPSTKYVGNFTNIKEDFNADDTYFNFDLSNSMKTYDMYNLVNFVIDKGSFFEVKSGFARNIITGFSRLGGRTVGIIANQPSVLAGSLTSDSSNKASQFIRSCDAFKIPILNLVDVPGFLPGIQQEHQGVIKYGAKMLFAYAKATVPKITVIIRKAYGGAFIAMCSKDLGADFVFALPTAEIAVVGPEGAMNIMFKGDELDMDKKLFDEYRKKLSNPYFAASRCHIDAIIELNQIRSKVINGFQILYNSNDDLK